MDNQRKDIQLSLSLDLCDDLASALEAQRNGMQRFAKESEKGFGLGPEYWTQRVADVQLLLDAVHRLAAGEVDQPQVAKSYIHAMTGVQFWGRAPNQQSPRCHPTLGGNTPRTGAGHHAEIGRPTVPMILF
ncbi:hypothetical protein D3C74_243240 [compost metagenome]